MSGRILERYTARTGDPAPELSAVQTEDIVDDLGSFGWLRGVRDVARSLELRKKTGNILAIGYSWIERFEFDPSEGITLHAHGQKIRIRGRNLNAQPDSPMRLFEGICRHRVPWVQEADRAVQLAAPQNVPLIEAIEW